MSQPKRYDCLRQFGMLPVEDGIWVEYDDYAALAAENERLKVDASDAYSLQSFLKWKGMQGEYQEWLDWRSERPSKEGGDAK